MKVTWKRLLQYPAVAYTIALFWGLLMLLVFVGMGSAVFSYSYFPLRLYSTGQKDIDIVKTKVYNTYFMRSGAMVHSYHLIGLKKNYKYSIERPTYQEIQEGDTINVFISDKTKKGLYLGN